jgi:predicted DsbA family dithiol-disulfide isomerase
VTWLPFDLHPEYPPEGIPREQLHARYGGAFHDRLRSRFEGEGLAYNPPPEAVPNTMRALRVTELARERGLHAAVHDRLMDAYWAEGLNIGDPDKLRRLAVEAGLDGAEVDEVLGGNAYRERVLGLTAQAVSIGITGVPGFLLDRRLLVLGAQPREVFERAFEQLEATSEAPPDP